MSNGVLGIALVRSSNPLPTLEDQNESTWERMVLSYFHAERSLTSDASRKFPRAFTFAVLAKRTLRRSEWKPAQNGARELRGLRAVYHNSASR